MFAVILSIILLASIMILVLYYCSKRRTPKPFFSIADHTGKVEDEKNSEAHILQFGLDIDTNKSVGKNDDLFDCEEPENLTAQHAHEDHNYNLKCDYRVEATRATRTKEMTNSKNWNNSTV